MQNLKTSTMNQEIKYEQPSKLFNEAEWLRLLFLIGDTVAWVQEMEMNVLYQLPVADKSKLFRKTYYLPATSLAHLLEKHYYKIARHPGCGKFTIDIANIVYWIKEAGHTEPQSISGSLNFKRCMIYFFNCWRAFAKICAEFPVRRFIFSA